MKRAFDLLLACIGLIIASPVLIVIAVLIRLESAGPILYRGKRVSRFNKPFNIAKFRTMVANAEQLGGSSTSDSDVRITKVGKVLRKFKLDELPQFFNVLLGQMSFVGPRPEVQEYVDLYTEEEQLILSMRPGITDWASIWNSNEGSVLAGARDPDQAYLELIRPTKLKLQLKYARKHSVWTDLKIITYTLFKLVNADFVPREIASFNKPRMASEHYKQKKAA